MSRDKQDALLKLYDFSIFKITQIPFLAEPSLVKIPLSVKSLILFLTALAVILSLSDINTCVATEFSEIISKILSCVAFKLFNELVS